jgi:hypothetical protein
MLHTRSAKFHTAEGVLEGSLSYPQMWNDGENGAACLTYVGMGDHLSGPAVALFNFAPGAALRGFAHSHRTDTFRIAIGDQPNQVKDGPRWLGHGDFLLMGANEVYVEQTGPDGMVFLVVFADRRGVPHGYDVSQEPPDLMSREWPERSKRSFGPDHFFPVHQGNEDAVVGLATTFADIRHRRPRLYGSMNDDANWTRVSDGSTLCAMFMSDPESGPMVLLSNNAPGAVEASAATYGTDVFRLVISGEVSVDGRIMRARQFRAVAAGGREGRIVHGPQGSTQVLVFADRRGWLPMADHGVTRELCPRMAEVAAFVERFVGSG